VRRNAAWREKFYALFFRYSKTGNADLADILNALFTQTGRIEASFASKFAATIDPSLPIIDQHVLTYIDRKLPSGQRVPADRLAAIVELHQQMREEFTAFLGTACGQYLIARFTTEHKYKRLSPMKILDFVLWQSGGKKPGHRETK
jgi:hypothetical protein